MRKTEKDKKQSKKVTERRAKSKERIILENVPVESQAWIKQPVTFSMLNGNFSKMQVVCMSEIMYSLQDRVNAVLAHYEKDRQQSLPLFEKGDLLNFKIPLKDINIPPDRYDILESSATELVSKHITQFVKGSTPEDDHVRFVNIFHSISIPARTTKSDATHAYRSCIEFELLGDDLQCVFDLCQYNTYLRSVLSECHSRYSARLYIFMTVYRSFGRWEPDYRKLRVMLGVDEVKRSGDGLVSMDKENIETICFPAFSNFKQKVLDVAEKELKQMAKENKIDCYFDYEPVYKRKDQKTGSPEKIRFTIHTTALGALRDEQTEKYNDWIEVESMLRNDLGLETSDIRKMKAMAVKTDDMKAFGEKIRELISYMASLKDKIENPKAYAITVLKTWLNDRTSANPASADIRQITAPRMSDDASAPPADAPSAGQPTDTAPAEVVGETPTGILAEPTYTVLPPAEWWQMLSDCKAAFGDRGLWAVLSLMEYVGHDDMLLKVAMPTKQHIDIMESDADLDAFFAIMRKHFGENTDLEYHLIK